MARGVREEVAGGVFHVYARGNGRQWIFHERRDRNDYLRLLDQAVSGWGWRCLAYCLMHNHVHLVIETVEPNLGRGMQRFHSTYAQRFNRRHGRSGHLFQGRYGAVLIRSDEQLWATVRYVALNPVEAGLTTRPEQYEWSSHAAVLRGDAPPFVAADRLLWYFGGMGGDPRERYSDFVGSSRRLAA